MINNNDSTLIYNPDTRKFYERADNHGGSRWTFDHNRARRQSVSIAESAIPHIERRSYGVEAGSLVVVDFDDAQALIDGVQS